MFNITSLCRQRDYDNLCTYNSAIIVTLGLKREPFRN